MHSAKTRTRLKTAGTFGVLALTGVLLLTACGGGSSTAESTPASSAPSAVASTDASMSASTEASGPPRPTGIPDADWTNILAGFDAQEYGNKLLAKSPEELADSCTKPALTPEDEQAAAENGVAAYPDSSVEEWVALYDFILPQMQAVKDEVCASAPAVDGAPAAATGSYDPPRPAGVSDADWATESANWDPEAFRSNWGDQDADALAQDCAMDPAAFMEIVIPPDWASELVARYPDSTAEDWNVFLDYVAAQLEVVRQDVCANQG